MMGGVLCNVIALLTTLISEQGLCDWSQCVFKSNELGSRICTSYCSSGFLL